MEQKLPVSPNVVAEAEAERPAGGPARVAVLKTRAEQGFTEAFSAAAGRLPGGAAVAKVRADALNRFTALGLPHRRIEAWKYTDLRHVLKEALPPATGEPVAVTASQLDDALGPLSSLAAIRVVFVDGVYVKDLSDLDGLEGIAGAPLAAALDDESDAGAADLLRLQGRDDDAVLALNTAYASDGAVLGIANGARLDKPLLLVFVRAGAEPQRVATRNAVSVGAGSQATIIEAFVTLPGAAASQHIAATEIGVGDEARVTHVKCVLAAGEATHLANWLVDIGAGADYRGFQLTAGVALARNQLAVTFKGEGTKLDLSGIFLARGTEHVDTTLLVDHAVPACESRELFKGVLEDEAHGIFQGKVIVRPGAQKTDGKQMAQVLMLSPNAEFDSKPELEIYADDVVCGHGSTSADLDEDLLFYCRSRGIPEAEARALLIESFVGEALAKVEREDVRQALTQVARGWLAEAAVRAR
jgi:Fe-S cluster assembly protein SufD